MRWEKLQIQSTVGEGCGPGKRWGHTCNAIRGGKLLYVFGGYGKDECRTNQVHVLDTGDSLQAILDGMNPLKDLHILDTSSNTWISPTVRGEVPEAREGHSAALIGKRLFIFGGCGKSSDNADEKLYDDLYILNTETFVWTCAVTSGAPPPKCDSHTCSSWKNKIIVIGGEDAYYLSDVHILDADTLMWGKLNTSGQLLPPRAGHTTVALGKNLFVFGGFTDESSLYDDIHMLDVDTGVWTKVMSATGEGPSPRFSMAGDSLDPQKGGVFVFIGGCSKNLEALDDMYYFHTGLARENGRDERRVEKLSLRKQLKLKCQQQNILASPVNDKALIRTETNSELFQPTSTPSIEASKRNISLREYHPFPGKRAFRAKVTKNFPVGFSIETFIDGKLLRGVLFTNKLRFYHPNDDSKRKKGAVKTDGFKLNDDQKSNSETARPITQDKIDDGKVDAVHGMSPAPSDASQPHEIGQGIIA